VSGGGELDYHDIARGALAFVLEDESWPVFLAWAREHHGTEAMHRWLETADLEATRNLFLAHSPDPYWRALAEAPRE
jgi:hypothetical protein